MVEKIPVRPEEVRGLGNIIIPKSLEDYETYESVLAEGSDEVYGTVYTMSYNHVPDFDGIVLSSDKDILSYADSDVASISAQLTYGGEPVAVSGETVTFEVRKVSDDSLVETLTSGTTNSSGIATTTMSSRGTGDVYIKAECTLVSKTYSITDIYLYDELTSAKHTWTKIDNNTTYSFTENGLVTQGSSGGCYLKLDETLPTNCSIEFTIKGFQSTSTGTNGGFGIDNSWIEPHTTNLQFAYIGGSSTTVSQVLTTNDVVKIIRQGTTYNYYVNDELKYTKNGKATGKYEYFFVRNVANSGVTFKDLKVREL